MQLSFLLSATYWLRVISLGLVVGVSIQFVQAWTAPSSTPPAGNVSGPITVGDVGQIKTGNLALNTSGLYANALLIPSGNVGIGTTNPTYRLSVGAENNPFQVSDAGDIIVSGGFDSRWALYKTDSSGNTSEKFSIEQDGALKVSTGLWIPTGAGEGKVLTSDAGGNASWGAASAASSGNIASYNNLPPGAVAGYCQAQSGVSDGGQVSGSAFAREPAYITGGEGGWASGCGCRSGFERVSLMQESNGLYDFICIKN